MDKDDKKVIIGLLKKQFFAALDSNLINRLISVLNHQINFLAL